jgi:hypothetical protein
MTSKVGQKVREKPFVASWQKDTEVKAMYMQRKTERNDELERLRRRYAGRAKQGTAPHFAPAFPLAFKPRFSDNAL